MPNKRKTLNRGQILANVVSATELTKDEVAKKAGYTRSSYYKHVEKPDLDFHIIMAYGRAINHDFTEEFPEMPKYTLEEPEEIYGQPKTLDEAIRRLEIWKTKYLEILEKYNRVIEERMGAK